MTEDDRLLFICAFRYALTRRNYVSDWMQDMIRTQWTMLSERDARLIQRDISEHIERCGERQTESATQSIDMRGWIDLSAWIAARIGEVKP